MVPGDMSPVDNSPPTNSLVTGLLTDLYQITMAYAYWKNKRHDERAIFELFFRKNPFGGEYTVSAGLDECLKYLQHFTFSSSDIAYLKTLPQFVNKEDEFFEWLGTLDTSEVTVHAVRDGTVVFPRIPLIVVQGPIAVCQLLETTLLTLMNYPSLIATNAARMVLAAENKITVPATITTFSTTDVTEKLPSQCYKIPSCVEFGLRRAQGPDGGFSASKYASIGGFVGTSNVQAGKLLGLTVSGTHAHAFVQSYDRLELVENQTIQDSLTGESIHLLPKVLEHRKRLAERFDAAYNRTNDGELAAFVAYAVAFPTSFLCLIDTYDTLQSGLLNFIVVSLAINDLGFKPRGVRLDSGDLAYLSLECAKIFRHLAASLCDGKDRSFFHELDIVVSNDINEAILHSLNEQRHAITIYGIGTNLVTCQAQPALGCVYKLVEIEGRPRMKLSQDISKVLIPGRKKPFRLYGKDQMPILDLMVESNDDNTDVTALVAGQPILCRHPFQPRKRAMVTPSRIESLHVLVFHNGTIAIGSNRSLAEAQQSVKEQLAILRPDILRHVNPTPYKVSITDRLFAHLHDLWQSETPIAELS